MKKELLKKAEKILKENHYLYDKALPAIIELVLEDLRERVTNAPKTLLEDTENGDTYEDGYEQCLSDCKECSTPEEREYLCKRCGGKSSARDGHFDCTPKPPTPEEFNSLEGIPEYPREIPLPTPEVSNEKIVTIPKEKDTKSEVSNDSWDNGNFVDEWDKYFGDTYGEDFYMNGADRRIMYKLLSKTRADERKKVVLKGERNRVIAQIRAEEREQTRKKVVKIADIIINNFKEL